MKSWDVYLDSFVNVMLPEHCDPNTPEGYEILHDAARQKFLERISEGDVSLNFERYEEGDE